ncbi:MAG: hypothetical protein R3A46_15140 [Thermomicrobiales bacterium]
MPIEQIKASNYDAYYNLAIRIGLEQGDDVAERYLEVLGELLAKPEAGRETPDDPREDERAPEVGDAARQLADEIQDLSSPHRLAQVARELESLGGEDRQFVLRALRDYVDGLTRSGLRSIERQGWYRPLRQQIDELE